MSSNCIIAIFLVAIGAQQSNAAVIAGTFGWTGDSGIMYGTASFTFDTDTSTGQVVGLYYPASGSWVGGPGGYWNFSLGISGRSIYPARVIITTFSELTDFSSRPIHVSGGISFEGQPSSGTIDGQLRWNLSNGGGYGVLDTTWFVSDGGLPSPSFRSGTTSNFVESIPEPSIVYSALCGAMVIWGMRRR